MLNQKSVRDRTVATRINLSEIRLEISYEKHRDSICHHSSVVTSTNAIYGEVCSPISIADRPEARRYCGTNAIR